MIDDVGPEVARRHFTMRLASGEIVSAEERFFLVRTAAFSPSRGGWTSDEITSMTGHRWWTLAELDEASAQVWPEDIAEMLRDAVAPHRRVVEG